MGALVCRHNVDQATLPHEQLHAGHNERGKATPLRLVWRVSLGRLASRDRFDQIDVCANHGLEGEALDHPPPSRRSQGVAARGIAE